jgi:hypothetical protein
MTSHTPGPWYIAETLSGAISINKTPQVPIAMIGGASWHLGDKVCAANARLMAEAPTMLDMLRRVDALIGYDPDVFDELRQLLARIDNHNTEEEEVQ